MSGLVYSCPDDKYSNGGSSEKEHKALNSNIPDDGPALLLINYDIVFVVSHPQFTSTNSHCLSVQQVDDSTSMKRGRPQSRWQESRDAISEIAQEAIKYDTDGVEVHFLNNTASKTCKVAILLCYKRDRETHSDSQSKYEVEKLFDSVKLQGWHIC